jgi:hypothetical protein
MMAVLTPVAANAAPDVLTAALQTAALGLPIFPVHGIVEGKCSCGYEHDNNSAGKHPALGHTFHSATTDEAVVRSWFSRNPHLNYGVATGKEIIEEKMLVVIDVDSYKAGADEKLAAVVAEHGPLPETAEVITGGGGRHLYFYAPMNVQLKSKLGHEGIDLKSNGGYVIGPGSRHRSGDYYIWEGSSDPAEGQAIADLPDWVIKHFAKPVTASVLPQELKEDSPPLTAAEIEDIQRDLDAIPADERNIWLEVLMALKSRSDSRDMFAIADNWSQKSDKYVSSADVQKTWTSIKPKDRGITIKTLKRLADTERLRGVDVSQIVSAPPANPVVGEWSELEPFFNHKEASTYPLHALPAMMRDAVVEVQDYMQAPVAMVSSSALAALSLAAQALYNVKRDEGLVGPISLYLMSIAESGERKSSLDNYFMRGIREYEHECLVEAAPELKKHGVEMMAWEAKNKGILEKIQRAAAGQGKADANEAAADLDAHSMKKPIPPTIPRLTYGDTTAEALIRNLSQCWPSGGVISSEGGAVLGGHAMRRDSQMANLAVLNELWDGKLVKVDRRTSENFSVPCARLTVAVQVQPTALSEFMRGSENVRGSGFFARFLLSHPKSTQGTRQYKSPPTGWPKLERFNARIKEILNAKPNINEYGLQPATLELSPQAMEVWVSFYNAIEQRLGTSGDLKDVCDVASKAADNAARIAALFHVLEADGHLISAENMSGATKLAEWHLVESYRVFSKVALPPSLRAASLLEEWVVGRCRVQHHESITFKDIQQRGPNSLRMKKDLEAAVNVLVEHGRAKINSGKPKSIQPHPELLGA